MSFADVTEAIRARFRTEVTEPHSLVVQHSNAVPEKNVQRWCQLYVEVISTQQVSVGARPRFRIAGRLVVNLFTRLNEGDGWLLQALDWVNTAFRSVTIADPQIRFDAPSPSGPSVRDEDGGYWRLPTNVPFRADVFGTTP